MIHQRKSLDKMAAITADSLFHNVVRLRIARLVLHEVSLISVSPNLNRYEKTNTEIKIIEFKN